MALSNSILDLVDLDLAEALDLEQIAASSSMHRSDGVVPVRFEFRNVNGADTVGLDGVDVNDETFL